MLWNGVGDHQIVLVLKLPGHYTNSPVKEGSDKLTPVLDCLFLYVMGSSLQEVDVEFSC